MFISLFVLLGLLNYVTSQCRFDGLAYDATYPSCDTSRIRNDIDFLSGFTSTLRIFGISECSQGQVVMRTIGKKAMDLYITVDLSGGETGFNLELQSLVGLINGTSRNKNRIKGVLLGDGQITKAAGNVTLEIEAMATRIQQTKQAISQNGQTILVSAPESIRAYRENTNLVGLVDFIYISELLTQDSEGISTPPTPTVPRHRRNTGPSADTEMSLKADAIIKEITDLMPTFGGKMVVLESGRATSGNTAADIGFNHLNTLTFVTALECKLQSLNITFIGYQAFDTGSTSNTTFGIFKSNQRSDGAISQNLFCC
ncbi:hypothetical protein BB560_001298 [Smittium megazygosporum]|uniref:glucan endo-1,3-beta-D-glucosidase n=1 Tax=Smittium megazygosporum TaxID=133381 RepID=A0A2T9ZHZ3_9FUNG|nr:hypothetical protein BB560_001298 [Smittium megazygosporum]